MQYKEVTFVDENGLQLRDRWLQWRHAGIGSSDACAIMGESRFNDYNALLEEKVLPEPLEDNRNAYIKDRGNKIEFQVRMFLEKHMGKSFTACNTEHTVFSFIRASLDGFSEDKRTIVEIKLLSSVNPANINTQAEGYKKWVAAREKQIVPAEYYPQIQHQLFVTGADLCFFVGYKEVKGNQVVTEEKLAIVPVMADKDYQRRMLQRCFEFWSEVYFRRQQLIYKGELD